MGGKRRLQSACTLTLPSPWSGPWSGRGRNRRNSQEQADPKSAGAGEAGIARGYCCSLSHIRSWERVRVKVTDALQRRPGGLRPSVDARTQHTSRQVAAVVAMLVQHFAVDDRVLDSLRGHDQAAAAARQVGAHLGPLGRIVRVVIEDGEVGGLARLQATAPLDAIEISRLRSDALDREFQRNRLPLA